MQACATTGKPLAKRFRVLVAVREISFTKRSLKLRFVIFDAASVSAGQLMSKKTRQTRVQRGFLLGQG
jgi:hypothetical protein